MNRTSPSRSSGYSAGSGSLTFSRSSASPQTSSAAPRVAPDRLVGVVGEGAAFAGARLDEHVVPALHELAGAGRRERDPVLVGLDLLDDSDLHQGEKP